MSNDHQGDREQQSVEPIDEAISEDRNESVSLEQQLADAQERLLRTQAELENYRKRARREYEEAQRYREIDLLRDLLPVLDNVLRAIEASTTTSDVESLR